jgi:tripartite-type tricarboxylate transporter receptor subunit TctC
MRRTLFAAATVLLGCAIALQALAYPDKAITIVVPVAPGGVTDFIGRLVSQNLAKKYSKSVIVENRVGAGTLMGANTVAKASPDGHTLLVMPLGTLFNSIISKTMPIDFERDLTPVSVIADQSLVLVVNVDLPVKDVKELVSYAKQKPNALSFGTAGPGSLPDVSVQLLMSMTDTRMVGIPYGGNAPAMTDLLTGRIHLLFLPLGSALPHINAGKIRSVGVSTAKRDPAAPDIPSISEGLPGYSFPTWQTLMVTGGTPDALIEQLHRDVSEITARPETIEKFKSLHLIRRPDSSPAKDKEFILSEFRKWKIVLEQIGLAGAPKQ